MDAHHDSLRPTRWFLGEFDTPELLATAVHTLREKKRGALDTHTPYPVHELEEALALPSSRIPLFVLVGGLSGATLGYLMMWWCNAVDYPINIGGRPENGIPTWIPIMFELTVLLGAFGAFFGLWAVNRLPRPHHPVFESERFRSATIDRFWVSVAVDDPTLTTAALESELLALGALHVDVVTAPAEAQS